MRDLKNKLTSSKNTKNTQFRRGKSFGYQVLGFGAGGAGNPFVAATGGTITTVDTDYKVHTFTGDGTFEVTNEGAGVVSYMVVAGGGGGGRQDAGGGGAGGFREGYTPGTYTASPLAASALPVTVQSYPITVGGGGAGRPANPAQGGGRGVASVFSSITSTGGGGGAGGPASSAPYGPGGSGGGGRRDGNGCGGGTGNTPPVSPAQGTNGGNPNSFPGPQGWEGAGGGGGATVAGQGGSGGSPSSERAGNGGNGATTSINGSPTVFAGGGGGGAEGNSPNCFGLGGTGGGGVGSNPGRAATSGTTNLGGGGGGVGTPPASGGGGSGVVIIRYKFQQENNMAHFAKISDTSEVLSVHVVNNTDILNADGIEDEAVGQQYLETHSNWPAQMWIQTSYNTGNNTHALGGTPFRGNYAGIGYTWDNINQIFWPEKNHASWVKNISEARWQSPIGDAPALTAEQTSQNEAKTHMWGYVWNETNTTWDLTDRLA